MSVMTTPLSPQLVIWGFFQLFFPVGPVGRTVYALIGAVVFSGYIVFDTHLLIARFDLDDYIWASVQLYLDIINLFLKILQVRIGVVVYMLRTPPHSCWETATTSRHHPVSSVNHHHVGSSSTPLSTLAGVRRLVLPNSRYCRLALAVVERLAATLGLRRRVLCVF